jgi:ABC-type phosphate transport system substrate-binding protein
MKTHCRNLVIFPLLIMLAVAGERLPAAVSDQVVVVVNSSNGVANLSATDLQKIFLGEKNRWPDGKHILVLMGTPGSSERATILKKVYKMSESDYVKYFIQASFTGEISAPPKDVSSAAQMKQLIAENPGAVGYLKQSDADGSVKVVSTIP